MKVSFSLYPPMPKPSKPSVFRRSYHNFEFDWSDLEISELLLWNVHNTISAAIICEALLM